MSEEIEIQVSRTSNVKKTANAIYHNVHQGKRVKVITIGERALNQATKALIICRGELAVKGMNMAWFSGFANVEGREKKEEITAIVTHLFDIRL